MRVRELQQMLFRLREREYPISIHTCARIATNGFAHLVRRQLILIHACARIATNPGIRLGDGIADILIHACARIATKAREWEE